jgi:hypothetical protein
MANDNTEIKDYNDAILELAHKSKHQPVRQCDRQAVIWLASKDKNGQLNFSRVYCEVRDFHKAHPRAAVRRDRLWTMSNQNHDLWVVVQRLLMAFNWRLADCINPRKSAADDDIENILEFADELFPASLALMPADWRSIKRMRKEAIQRQIEVIRIKEK